MVIGIDGNEANLEKRVGVNQYAFELLLGLYKLPESKKHLFVIYLKDNPRSDLPPARNGWQYKILRGGGAWIIKTLMPYLFKNPDKLDVFFTPSHYVPPFSRVPRVCCIMDLGYLKSKEQFRAYDYWQLRIWTAWSLFVSKNILAISDATKKDIVDHYPFAKEKTQVVLLAGDSSVTNTIVKSSDIVAVRKKYSLPKKYVLFLGTLKPSKNITGLISAWSQISSKFPEYKLVVAGKKGWLYNPIFEHVKKLKVEKQVIFTDFMPDCDKPSLIKGATLFVLPSFWEGFGIDVVNSMASGVPVVASNRGSLPEVVGNAGFLVNPDNTHEIASKITKVLLMSKKEYNNLSLKSVRQAKRFSWEKTARDTLRIITDV